MPALESIDYADARMFDVIIEKFNAPKLKVIDTDVWYRHEVFQLYDAFKSLNLSKIKCSCTKKHKCPYCNGTVKNYFDKKLKLEQKVIK